MLKLIKSWLANNYNTSISKIIFIIYLSIVLYGTLSPALEIGKPRFNFLLLNDFEHGDKIVHIILFFILTLTYYFAFIPKKILYHIGVPFIIGLTIEYLQYIMPFGRSFELKDLLANTLGILIAFYFNKKIAKNLVIK